MKTMLCGVLLLLAGSAFADSATGVQAVPSDKVRYPDASEVLNKADPKTNTLPVNKLAATKPVPAQTAAPAAVAGTKAGTTGWYLKWTMSDEASARSWAASLNMPAEVSAVGTQWQVLIGPLTAESLKLLSAQTGKAMLVRN